MNVFKQDCRAILKISGADALKFINGICTKDIFHLAAEKASANVGFLNARGRLLYDAFIHPDVTGAQKYGSFDGNNILVDCEEAIIDDFEMHLKRYKLRSDVEITRVRDVCVIEAQMESSFSDRSPLRITDKTLDKRFPTTLNMHRTLINRSEFDFFIENLKTSDKVIDGVCDLHKGSGSFESYPMSAKHHYKMLRMRYGIAEGYEEIDSGHYMPFELNLDRQGAIDFKKGCYLGQELVARTHYKGIVRKRLCPIRFTFAKPMGLDESISLPEFKEDSTLMKNELFQSWIEDFNIDMNIKIGSPLMTEKGSMGKIVAVNGNVGLAVIRLLDEELLNTPDSQEFTSTRFDYRSFAVESEIGQLLIAQRRYEV